MSKHTIQNILQQQGADITQRFNLPLHYLKALEKLSLCRTAALGGHAQYCENNHLNGIWYNSCKHRACPQCRGLATEEWLINTKEILLDCPHHHIIFTLPSTLNELWRYNQSEMTNILFKAAQQTLKQFAKDPQYLTRHWVYSAPYIPGGEAYRYIRIFMRLSVMEASMKKANGWHLKKKACSHKNRSWWFIGGSCSAW